MKKVINPHSLIIANRFFVFSIILLLSVVCVSFKAGAQFSVYSAKAQKAGNTTAIYTQEINGNLYQIGTVTGNGFSTTVGNTYGGNPKDIYFIAYDTNGNIRYSRFLGGNADEVISGFTVGNGKVYMYLTTTSTNLPVTDGSAYTSGAASNGAAFVLNDGTGAIEFGTYVNGNGTFLIPPINGVENISLDGTNFIVTGTTSSSTFFTTDGSTLLGAQAVFIRKYSANGTILFSKLLGGSGIEYFRNAITQNGKTFVLSSVDNSNFPVTDGSNITMGTTGGMVLTCVNSAGTIEFSKYVYPEVQQNYMMFSDNTGVYLGSTHAYSAKFPTTTGSYGGGANDFVAIKYDLSGNLIYARYIGGASIENNDRIMVLSNGSLYISGTTYSTNYPVVNQGAGKMGGGGTTDVIITKLNSSGDIDYSTSYGGTGSETINAMDVINGEAYVYVGTNGTAPTTDGTTSGSGALAKFTTNGKLCMASMVRDNYYTASQNGLVHGDKAYFASAFTSSKAVTQPYAASATGDPGLVIFDICPPLPTVTSDPVSPVTQTVCKNSPVQQLVGSDIYLDAATNLPLLYVNGVATQQSNIYFEYQWQSAPSATGPWTDIAGATEKNYSPSPASTNTYFRRITRQNECCGGAAISTSDVAAVLVSSNLAPVADAGGGATRILQTCAGTVITLGGSPSASGGSGGGYVYSWSNSAVTANPSVTPGSGASSSTVYTLTVTDGIGCTQVDQVIVNAYKANAGPDKTICNSGDIVQIGTAMPAGATGITYSWTKQSGDGTLNSTTIAQPTLSGVTVASTYRVTMTVTKSGGGTCSTFDDVIISPNTTTPRANFAGSDQVLCFSSATATLGTPAEAGFTSYSWSPTSYLSASNIAEPAYNSGSLNLPTPNKITYTVTATSGTCIFTDQVEVAVIEANAGPDGCGPRYIGTNDRTPGVNETYQWTVVSGTGHFLGATDQPVIPVGASVGANVTYRLTTTYNGVSCTDDVLVPVSCGAPCDIVVESNSGCASYAVNGGPVTLSAVTASNPANYTYSWSPATGLSSTTTQKVNVLDNVARTYTVTITSILDPTWTCTKSIDVNKPTFAAPAFTAPSSVFACSGAAKLIGDPTNNPGYTYAWTGPNLTNATSSQPTSTTPASANYYVVVTDNVSGCKFDQTIVLTRTTPANAGPDKSLCGSGTVTLGTPAEAGYTYSWAAGNWQNGTDASSAQPDALVAATTTFTLTKTHTASGCASTDQATVTVNPAIPPFSLSSLTYCPSGTALVLGYSDGTTGGTNQIPSGYSYAWSPAGMLSSSTIQNPTLLTPMPGTATTFTVTATAATGCTQTATQTVTPTLSGVDAGSDKSMCAGSSVAIGSSSNPTGAGISYSWSFSPATGSLSSSTSPNPTFTSSTAATYDLTVTKTEGSCSSTDVVRVIVSSVSLSVNSPATVCAGTAVTIGPSSVDNSLSYLWSPSTGMSDPTTAKQTITATGTQTYTLTATNTLGCQASQNVLVSVSAATNPVVSVAPVTACSGNAVSFNAMVSPAGTYNYSWSPATNLNSTTIANPTINSNVVSTNTYTLTVTDAATGCNSTTANLTAAISACPTFIVNISGNVFEDYTGDNTVNGTGIGKIAGTQLYISLIAPDGKVIASVPVNADGTYAYTNVTNNVIYSAVLSTTPGIAGSNAPSTNLPTNWLNTGEHLGTSPGRDGINNGILPGIAVGSTNVTDANFAVSNYVMLPAKGLTLSAGLRGSKVNLNWQTTSEENTAYFELERSTDNNSFTKTGEIIAAAGYSASTQNYSAADDISYLSSDHVFYRIKLYDKDGEIRYSNVVVVWLQNKNQLKVWPNPFAESIQINYNSRETAKIELRLIDVMGRMVLNKTLLVATGINQINMKNLDNLSNGNYMLMITERATGQTTTYKLIKQ